MEAQWRKVITLLITAAITHTVDSEVKHLDKSPNAVDDQFLGCREEMLQKVLKNESLLQEELKANAMFSQAWNDRLCRNPQSQIPDSLTEHSQALALYTKGSLAFRQFFDAAMQSHGGNATAYQGFRFKALHFLLTDVLRILRPKICVTVFQVSEHIFQTNVGDIVRFGKFFPATSEETEDLEDLLTIEKGTVFNITSCAAVSVGEYACYPEEFDLLIPPFEEFRVLNVMDSGHHRIISLNHTRLYSNHDCLFFRSSNDLVKDSSNPVTSSNDLVKDSSNPVTSSILLLLAALFQCW